MRLLVDNLFLWFANRIPNLFPLRIAKAALLRMAGADVDWTALYFMSPISIDRPRRLLIGRGVFINRNCTFEGQGRIRIGNNVQIGPNAVFATTDHNLGDMSEDFGDITILDNVWIGANATFLQGVTIGPNVIVGAGAVVTKSYRDCVIVGVPARVIKGNAA